MTSLIYLFLLNNLNFFFILFLRLSFCFSGWWWSSSMVSTSPTVRERHWRIFYHPPWVSCVVCWLLMTFQPTTDDASSKSIPCELINFPSLSSERTLATRLLIMRWLSPWTRVMWRSVKVLTSWDFERTAWKAGNCFVVDEIANVEKWCIFRCWKAISILTFYSTNSHHNNDDFQRFGKMRSALENARIIKILFSSLIFEFDLH